MKDQEDDMDIVAVVRSQGSIKWYRAPGEVWVLDWQKWRDDFLKAGFKVPPWDSSDRFGISIVDEHTAEEFLTALSRFEVPVEELRTEFLQKLPMASSWWDVSELFPVLFVDFDRCHLAAFYGEGVRFEKYIPDGWTSEFADFSMKFDEATFPEFNKFWVVDGCDKLEELNRLGEENKPSRNT